MARQSGKLPVAQAKLEEVQKRPKRPEKPKDPSHSLAVDSSAPLISSLQTVVVRLGNTRLIGGGARAA